MRKVYVLFAAALSINAVTPYAQAPVEEPSATAQLAWLDTQSGKLTGAGQTGVFTDTSVSPDCKQERRVAKTRIGGSRAD